MSALDTTGFVTKDSGERRKFETGAQRDVTQGKGRYDLLSPLVNRRLAQLYQRGAAKYDDRNWEKGMPFSACLDSLKRHADDFHEGKTDEDHLAAIIFNAACLIHFQECIQRGILPASLDDLPRYVARVVVNTAAKLPEVFPDTPPYRGDITLTCPLRIYVAGPYSVGDVGTNVHRAAMVATELMELGHMVHCPHTHTHQLEALGRVMEKGFTYEDWLTLDFTYIDRWATAIYRIPGPSPGADREVQRAKDRGLLVFTQMEHVPPLSKTQAA